MRLDPDKESDMRAGCLLTCPQPPAREGVDPACLAGVEIPNCASVREASRGSCPPRFPWRVSLVEDGAVWQTVWP